MNSWLHFIQGWVSNKVYSESKRLSTTSQLINMDSRTPKRSISLAEIIDKVEKKQWKLLVEETKDIAQCFERKEFSGIKQQVKFVKIRRKFKTFSDVNSVIIFNDPSTVDEDTPKLIAMKLSAFLYLVQTPSTPCKWNGNAVVLSFAFKSQQLQVYGDQYRIEKNSIDKIIMENNGEITSSEDSDFVIFHGRLNVQESIQLATRRQKTNLLFRSYTWLRKFFKSIENDPNFSWNYRKRMDADAKTSLFAGFSVAVVGFDSLSETERVRNAGMKTFNTVVPGLLVSTPLHHHQQGDLMRWKLMGCSFVDINWIFQCKEANKILPLEPFLAGIPLPPFYTVPKSAVVSYKFFVETAESTLQKTKDEVVKLGAILGDSDTCSNALISKLMVSEVNRLTRTRFCLSSYAENGPHTNCEFHHLPYMDAHLIGKTSQPFRTYTFYLVVETDDVRRYVYSIMKYLGAKECSKEELLNPGTNLYVVWDKKFKMDSMRKLASNGPKVVDIEAFNTKMKFSLTIERVNAHIIANSEIMKAENAASLVHNLGRQHSRTSQVSSKTEASMGNASIKSRHRELCQESRCSSPSESVSEYDATQYGQQSDASPSLIQEANAPIRETNIAHGSRTPPLFPTPCNSDSSPRFGVLAMKSSFPSTSITFSKTSGLDNAKYVLRDISHRLLTRICRHNVIEDNLNCKVESFGNAVIDFKPMSESIPLSTGVVEDFLETVDGFQGIFIGGYYAATTRLESSQWISDVADSIIKLFEGWKIQSFLGESSGDKMYIGTTINNELKELVHFESGSSFVKFYVTYCGIEDIVKPMYLLPFELLEICVVVLCETRHESCDIKPVNGRIQILHEIPIEQAEKIFKDVPFFLTRKDGESQFQIHSRLVKPNALSLLDFQVESADAALAFLKKMIPKKGSFPDIFCTECACKSNVGLDKVIRGATCPINPSHSDAICIRPSTNRN